MVLPGCFDSFGGAGRPQAVVTSADLPRGVNTNYIAAGGGYGWNTDEAKGVVYKVDSNGNVVDTFHSGEGAC